MRANRINLNDEDMSTCGTTLNIMNAGERFEPMIRRLVQTTSLDDEAIAARLYPRRDSRRTEGFNRFVDKIRAIRAEESEH